MTNRARSAASETPQDAGEVERRDVPPDGIYWFLQGFAAAKAECQKDHADLVKRAEDAEAREARLRAGIEALAVQIEGWEFHRGSLVMDYTEVCDLVDALRAIASPDADAQDEGSCQSCGLVGRVAIECPECGHTEAQEAPHA